MEILRVLEKAKVGSTFRFVPIGDAHLGSLSSDVGHLRRTIDDIASDPMARWLGMGDLVESIAPDDKRWNPKAVESDAKDKQERIGDWYVNKVAEVFAPIMDKCWGMCDGNHEDRFGARYFTNLTLRVLEKFGKESLYGGWACATNVRFEDDNNHRCSLKVFNQHGWQAGRKDGALINSLEDLMGWMVGCDIYLVAHSHKRLMKVGTKLGFNQKWDNFEVYDTYAAHTGSFLKTYQKGVVGYGEKKGYPPTSLGPIEFRITTSEKGVKVVGLL